METPKRMTDASSHPDLRPGPLVRASRALSRPTVVALAALGVMVMLGWVYLGLMVAGMAAGGQGAALGPGMAVFDLLGGGALPDGLAKALVAAICSPSFGHDAAAGVGEVALLVAMWVAMAAAMMLPTAGPMIVTYAEMAERARRRGEAAVSPLVLIAGYGGIWLVFAVVGALLQAGLSRAALIDPAMASASPLFSGAIFLGAGAYQFSDLKFACVTRCQRPFPFFLVEWTTRAAGVFRLGLRQGLFCLGCCWAMMLVMFAVGVMNVVWMAALGLIMGLEKIAVTTRFSKAIGVVFLAIGAVLIGTAVAAHWPGRPA